MDFLYWLPNLSVMYGATPRMLYVCLQAKLYSDYPIIEAHLCYGNKSFHIAIPNLKHLDNYTHNSVPDLYQK